jgi:hypothetical protein
VWLVWCCAVFILACCYFWVSRLVGDGVGWEKVGGMGNGEWGCMACMLWIESLTDRKVRCVKRLILFFYRLIMLWLALSHPQPILSLIALFGYGCYTRSWKLLSSITAAFARQTMFLSLARGRLGHARRRTAAH